MDDFSALPDDEARRLLRLRKKRARTSCYPCRTRKVKCDRSHPCDNCSKRGYSELCTFGDLDNQKGTHRVTTVAESRILDAVASVTPKASDAGQQFIATNPLLTNSDGSRVDLLVARSVLPDVAIPMNDSAGTPAENPQMSRHVPSYVTPTSDGSVSANSNNDERSEGEPYLGVNSMPAFIRDHTAYQDITTTANINSPQRVEGAIMPMLGLEESGCTYPFLPATNNPLQDPRITFFQDLPADREVIR